MVLGVKKSNAIVILILHLNREGVILHILSIHIFKFASEAVVDIRSLHLPTEVGVINNMYDSTPNQVDLMTTMITSEQPTMDLSLSRT